jgi:hypothetical protein
MPLQTMWQGQKGRARLEAWADDLLIEEGKRFLSTVARASHLTDDSPLDLNYYLRHRIETIWRIWLTARIDALALAAMIDEDYESARQWARYAADELDHDQMFLADLAIHGITGEQVRRTPPFRSTRDMVAQIEREITSLGSLPALAYALFVEWNAERFSAKAVKKAESSLSDRHVAGAKRHVKFDTDESHLPMILDITHRLILQRGDGVVELQRLMLSVASRFRDYFSELDASASDASLAKPS